MRSHRPKRKLGRGEQIDSNEREVGKERAITHVLTRNNHRPDRCREEDTLSITVANVGEPDTAPVRFERGTDGERDDRSQDTQEENRGEGELDGASGNHGRSIQVVRRGKLLRDVEQW